MSNLEAITCPTCGKKNTWKPDNPSRPFCCERCRLIDLGEWANESYKVSTEARSDDDPSS